MIIKTKFDIGDVFYRPKSTKRSREVVITGDDGLQYTRWEDSLSPEVDTVQIVQIDTIADGIEPLQVIYRCKIKNDTVPYYNADHEGFVYFWNRAWDTSELESYVRDYDRAKEIAVDYAVHKKATGPERS